MSDNADHEMFSQHGSPKLEPVGICHMCKHRIPGFPPTCAAFPQGIPAEVVTGRVLHTSPYPGDSGIVFEQKGAPTIDVQPYVDKES